MIRTLFKLALLVAVVAFFVPRETRDGEPLEPALSPVVLFYGATQALSDLGGFCERAPAACSSGREAAAYAGTRVMEGVALLVAMATGTSAEPAPERQGAAPTSRTVAPRTAEPAAVVVPRGESTGSIAPGPRPYQPPSGAALPVPPSPPSRQAAPALAALPPRAPAATPRAPAAASSAPGRPAVPTAGGTAAVRPQTSVAARADEPSRRPAGVPGSEKPFRMPGMAGGAQAPVSPRPFALVPPPAPNRAPVPLAAPRA